MFDIASAIDSANRLILPYDSQDVEDVLAHYWKTDIELSTVLGDLIARDLGYENGLALQDGEEMKFLDKGLLNSHEARLLICFDGIERFRLRYRDTTGRLKSQSAPREFLLALNMLIETAFHKTSRLKFLITCVEPTWSEIGTDRFLIPVRFPSLTF